MYTGNGQIDKTENKRKLKHEMQKRISKTLMMKREGKKGKTQEDNVWIYILGMGERTWRLFILADESCCLLLGSMNCSLIYYISTYCLYTKNSNQITVIFDRLINFKARCNYTFKRIHQKVTVSEQTHKNGLSSPKISD